MPSENLYNKNNLDKFTYVTSGKKKLFNFSKERQKEILNYLRNLNNVQLNSVKKWMEEHKNANFFNLNKRNQMKNISAILGRQLVKEVRHNKTINEVKNLLNSGASANETNKNGYTPLFIASSRGRMDMIKFLLDRGADPNKAVGWAEDEATPLIIATEKRNKEAMKLLLDKGAAPNKGDKNGWTPLHVASKRSHYNLIRRNCHIDVLTLLLSTQGIDVNKADNRGYTALHWASRSGLLAVAELLLDKGADVNKRNNEGQTPLDVAKTVEIKKLLMEAMGIDIPWKIMNANQRRKFKPVLIQRMLLNYGSNKNFTEPIFHDKYNLKTLKPINNSKNIGSLGLVIDNKNVPRYFANATLLRNTIRSFPNGILRGLFHKNWSLINVTPQEYQNAWKSLGKKSAMVKGARTRFNLRTRKEPNRIEANQKRTGNIAEELKKMRNAQRRLNNLNYNFTP